MSKATATKPRKVSSTTRRKKAKVAKTLFDLAKGATELPSDERVVSDAAAAITKAIEKLRAFDCESRLAIARNIAKQINSMTKAFNVAVFLCDKDQPLQSEPLFPEKQGDVAYKGDIKAIRKEFPAIGRL